MKHICIAPSDSSSNGSNNLNMRSARLSAKLNRMSPLAARLVCLLLGVALLSPGSNAERDFNVNDSQVPLLEPKDVPAYKQHPYIVDLAGCQQSQSEILLSLVLKKHDWSELSAIKRGHVQSKLAKFFAIPQEFIVLDSVSKHNIKLMQKTALRQGGKAKHIEVLKAHLGRASFVIGCGSTFFSMGEPIAKQIAHQFKDGTISALTDENFGFWFVWRKESKSRTQRQRRQAEGSGVEEEDYDYDDDETPEPVTELQTVTPHGHRHHHGMSELSEVATPTVIVVSQQSNAVDKTATDRANDLLLPSRLNEEIEESVSQLESVISKTIENTKNIKELPVMSIDDVDEDVELGVPASPEISASDRLLEEFGNELELKTPAGASTAAAETYIPLVESTTMPTTAHIIRHSATVNPISIYEDAALKINSDNKMIDNSATADVERTATSTSLATKHNINATPAAGVALPTPTFPLANEVDTATESAFPLPPKGNEHMHNKLQTAPSFSPYDVDSPALLPATASTGDAVESSASVVSTLTTNPKANIITTNSNPIIITTTTTTASTSTNSVIQSAIAGNSASDNNTSNTATTANFATLPTTTTASATTTSTTTTAIQSQTPKSYDAEATTYSYTEDADAEVVATSTSQSISEAATSNVQTSLINNKEDDASGSSSAGASSNSSATQHEVSSTATLATSIAPATVSSRLPVDLMEVSSTTYASTDYVEPRIENSPPIIKTRLQKLAITSGKAFTFIVPTDTFTDAEDLTNLRLELTDKDGHELKHTSWLQFNAGKRELYGLPLDDTVSRWQYRLSATDSGNASVTEIVEISVQQHRGLRTINHDISIAVKINEKHLPNIDWQLKLINGLVRTLNDNGSGAIVVREIRQSPQDPHAATFVYFNETLPTSVCPEAELNEIVARLDTQRLDGLVQPLLGIKSISKQLTGTCQKTELPKPKPTLQMAKNLPPMPRNQVDRVNASAGQLLVYKVPSDTFYDPNDNELTLTLKTKNHKELKPYHWLQFDSKNEEFYGIPQNADTGSEEYLLVAEDTGGLTATDALVVVVNHAQKREYSVLFKAYLAVRHENFHADLQRKFVERVAQLHGDPNTDQILVKSIGLHHDTGTTVVSFFNTSLHKENNRCPDIETALTRNVYLNRDSTLRDSVKKALGSELNLTSVTVFSFGSCHQSIDVHPNAGIPARPEEPSRKSPFSNEFLATFVLPAVIIVAMIILASIIACCLHRRRHKSGKMELGDEEERKSFRTKGIPVIFQDELDEKPEIGNKSPVILKDEKPPLLPPSYNTSNMNGDNDVDEYVPPPAVVVGGREVRGKSPATPSYRKPPPYVSP